MHKSTTPNLFAIRHRADLLRTTQLLDAVVQLVGVVRVGALRLGQNVQKVGHRLAPSPEEQTG